MKGRRVARGRTASIAGFGVAAAIAAMLAPADAGALPLFAGETGESCAACHAGSRATDKIGGFVPGLSVNQGAAGLGPFGRTPTYVPLAVLMDARLGSYGSGLGVLGRSGAPEVRSLTVDGFWLPTRRLRFGAQYTIYNRLDAPADAADGARAGTLFLYLRRDY